MAMNLEQALALYKNQNQPGGPIQPAPPREEERGTLPEAPVAADVTLNDLEALCAQIATERSICDQISAVKKEQDRKLEDQERKLLDLLRALEKTSYQSKVGTFSVSHRLSVRIPGTPEARTAFFDYLKNRGLFEQMITVNSATLNSFYKNEFEIAKEQGDGMDFEMPGIGEPSISETISFRKAK